MRALFLLAILLTAGLVGCLGGEQRTPGDGASSPPRTPEERSIPWGLTDCTALVWFVPADAEAVAEQLPDGFTPAGVIGTPTGDPPPAADGYLGFEAFTCETGRGLDGPVEGMTYATVFTSVVPPAELAVEGVGGQHYYKWHVLVPEEPRRTFLQDVGVPAVDGSVSLTQPAPGVWSASFELDGLGAFAMTGPTQGPPSASEGSIPFAEFTPAEGGFATWTASATNISRAAGAGTWTVPGGSWMADVLGDTRGAAPYDLDRWSFAEAAITLPGNATVPR